MTAFSKLELQLDYLESKLNYLLLLRRAKRRRIRRFLERKRPRFWVRPLFTKRKKCGVFNILHFLAYEGPCALDHFYQISPGISSPPLATFLRTSSSMHTPYYIRIVFVFYTPLSNQLSKHSTTFKTFDSKLFEGLTRILMSRPKELRTIIVLPILTVLTLKYQKYLIIFYILNFVR